MVNGAEQRIFNGLFLLFLVAPPILLIGLSFGSEWSWPGLLPGTWTTAHWSRVLIGDRGLLDSLLTSLVMALSVSITATSLGFLTARSIAYAGPGRTKLLAAYSPYVISPILYAIWLHIFFVKSGLSGTHGGVFTGQFLLAYPYSVLFFQGFWNQQTREYELLGATLGCSFTTTQLRIILPLARGMLAVCLFQCFLISWFEFGLTSLIGIGKIKTLPILVYSFIQEANIHMAAVASLLIVFPVMAISWWQREWILKKV